MPVDYSGFPLAKKIVVDGIYIYDSPYCTANVVRVTEFITEDPTPWNEGTRIWGMWYNSISDAIRGNVDDSIGRLYCCWDKKNLYEASREKRRSGFAQFITKIEANV
jgi:hypothetical protein